MLYFSDEVNSSNSARHWRYFYTISGETCMCLDMANWSVQWFFDSYSWIFQNFMLFCLCTELFLFLTAMFLIMHFSFTRGLCGRWNFLHVGVYWWVNTLHGWLSSSGCHLGAIQVLRSICFLETRHPPWGSPGFWEVVVKCTNWQTTFVVNSQHL